MSRTATIVLISLLVLGLISPSVVDHYWIEPKVAEAEADIAARERSVVEKRAATRKRLVTLLVERANFPRPEAELFVADVCNAVETSR